MQKIVKTKHIYKIAHLFQIEQIYQEEQFIFKMSILLYFLIYLIIIQL